MLELLDEKPVLWIPYSNPKGTTFFISYIFLMLDLSGRSLYLQNSKVEKLSSKHNIFYLMASGGFYYINMNTLLNTWYKTQFIDFMFFMHFYPVGIFSLSLLSDSF